MEQNLENNPFAALFPSIKDAETFCSSKEVDFQELNESTAKETLLLSHFLERIFLVTLDKESAVGRPDYCIYLAELASNSQDQTWLDLNIIDQAVFERILLDNPANYAIQTRLGKARDHVSEHACTEVRALFYLCQSYIRACHEQPKVNNLWIQHCKELIITMSRTVLVLSETCSDQDIEMQFLHCFLEYLTSSDFQSMQEFLQQVASAISEDDGGHSLLDILTPALSDIKQKLLPMSLVDTNILRYLEFLKFMTTNTGLGEVLITFTTPQNIDDGKAYEFTLLGSVLSLSCLMKTQSGKHEFFEKPSSVTSQEHKITETNLWKPIFELNETICHIFLSLLKLSPQIRHSTLNWLGKCLHCNADRAKLWTRHFMTTDAGDGFFLNLGNVLLRLCKPFSEPNAHKLLNIDFSYTKAAAVTNEDVKNRGIHLQGLAQETTLIPSEEAENNNRELPNVNYNFTTECFFFTHYCLHLGFHVVHGKFLKLSQELGRLQRLYEDARAQGGDGNDTVQRIREAMDKGMTRYLSMKAALLEPQSLELALHLHTATASLLSHVATHVPGGNPFAPVKFPLTADVPEILTDVPEFIVENVVDYMSFLRRFSDITYQVAGKKLQHLLTLILVFMGSPERMKNPHLRARLAEALSCLLPHHEQQGLLVSMNNREQLLQDHSCVEHLAATLLHVFVSIEVTGQSVAFEEKFNYRRPMYAVLKYIWNVEIHRTEIKKLASYSLDHIEATQPPLFLRFINLLINDAIFLLDEALTYMSQLKEKEAERESRSNQNLPSNQRQQEEANFQHLSLLARFHNVMGNETIQALEFITKEIKDIFLHNMMVDRIAAMLNYFLLHLVGPKQRDLKVKSFADYEFKPDAIVYNICLIYLNLGESSQFCAAVSRDGRSYSSKLFFQAEKVLIKTGHGHYAPMIRALAEKIKDAATIHQKNEEMFEEAPEEFLDPILGTLMEDPVVLPTSNNIVDRATIARHILSDQSDPFNRAPLTMDMVVPDEELKQRIADWMAKHRSLKRKS